MDLRRLRAGSIDDAYVGSTLSPEQVVEEEGLRLLAWVGDHFQIPTVGVAVDPLHFPLDSPALEALVRANKRALRTLSEQPRPVVDYIASFLDRLTRDEAQRYYERYIGAKRCLWHGRWKRCLVKLITTYRWTAAKSIRDAVGIETLRRHLRELIDYLEANQAMLVNYGARRRRGEPISTAFVQSVVNEIVARRMIKKQQMR